jgi:hypothetical protein
MWAVWVTASSKRAVIQGAVVKSNVHLMAVGKIKALRKIAVKRLCDFITSMFYILNRFLVIKLWRLRGREVVGVRDRHPLTL